MPQIRYWCSGSLGYRIFQLYLHSLSVNRDMCMLNLNSVSRSLHWFTATAVLASCREEFSFVDISVNCKMDNPNNQMRDSVGVTREF